MSEEGLSVVWTYLGRRYRSGGAKLQHAWLDEDDQIVYFKKLKATAVGGQYQVTRVSDDSVRTNVEFLGDSGDERTAEWVAEDRAAWTASLQAAAEKKLARDRDIGELTLNQVRRLIDGAGPSRQAMIATVLKHLWL